MIRNLLRQIKNKKIEQLLPLERYKFYYSIYNRKRVSSRNHNILKELKPKVSELEKNIIALLLKEDFVIKNIAYLIYIREYFPQLVNKVKTVKNLMFETIYDVYCLDFNKYRPSENNFQTRLFGYDEITQSEEEISLEHDELIYYESEEVSDSNQKLDKEQSSSGSTNSSVSVRSKFVDMPHWVTIFNLEKKVRKNIFKLIEYHREIKDKDRLKNNTDEFLKYYNTKCKVLKDTALGMLINLAVKYLHQAELYQIYDFIEDKLAINHEINKKGIYLTLNDKIVRDTLITYYALIDLKVIKREFYKTLNKLTMVNPDLFELNLRKYIEILKIVKCKHKTLLLEEWLKTFIYYGRIDLFMKLYRKMKCSDVFRLFYRTIRRKNPSFRFFILRCQGMDDSKYTIYSYSAIIKRYEALEKNKEYIEID